MRALVCYKKFGAFDFCIRRVWAMKPLAILLCCVLSVFSQIILPVSKIINGELAVEGQFPHVVQLSIRRKEATRYCGGSLLDSQWVLTVSMLKKMVEFQTF